MDSARPRSSAGETFLIAALAVLGLVLVLAVARSSDPLFKIQIWTMIAGFAIGLALLVARVGDSIAGAAAPTRYQDNVIKPGVIASMFWGLAGMLVGVVIALQLAFPDLFYFPDLA
jgi:cytochrome c oxidase cbb3-type subunit 1